MSAQERKYNYIFEELAGEPDDLIGLLAYGIYKREKIEYIKSFWTKHDRGPTDDELAVFHDLSMSRLSSYLRLAESDLAEFQNLLIEDHATQLSDTYERRLNLELRSIKPSWKDAILQSFLGSVLFTIFIGALAVLLIGWRGGINTIVQESVKLFTGQ
ncbi:hypothetical protein [Megalodesulfovibrio paquesii]